ncbi:hypothetical protein V8C42DRAFT_348995 [Trichoderma barbatum]
MKFLSTFASLHLLSYISAVIAGNPELKSASASLQGDGTFKQKQKRPMSASTRGGKDPSASNKQDFSQDIGKTVTLTSGKNGWIDGVKTIGPAPPSSGFLCPRGQKLCYLRFFTPPWKLQSQLVAPAFLR